MNENIDITQPLQFSAQLMPACLAFPFNRDSGYKNTAYALAELIDNSQQANASLIEVICIEQHETVDGRERLKLAKIGVLDNGDGMDAATLQMALQFGNGTRLNDRTGIGRFGIGLPNASISQAARLDVWSWQNGPDNALHTFLDVEEVESGATECVPEPTHNPLPDSWRWLSEELGDSGTLVVWSKLDTHRLTWKRARSTLANTERLVGRIYRRFIRDHSLEIRLVVTDGSGGVSFDERACYDDPLYSGLMSYHD